MKRVDSAQSWAQGQPVPPGAEVEHAAPARPADLKADWLLPLSQAITTGILLGAVFGLGLPALLPELGLEPVQVFGTAALAVATVAWLILLGQHRRLLWAMERLTGQDLDGDRKVGKPQERIVVLDGRQRQAQAAQQQQHAELSAFGAFVARIPHKGTSLRAWEPEIGRDQYQAYRDLLIEYGFAQWRSAGNERQGWELVMPAREILRRLR